MTLVAHTFVVTNREADTLGLAALCPEARYASVRWRRADRIERRHASSAEWKEIERQIAEGLPAAPLPRSGVFSRVLVGGAEDKRVQYTTTMPIEADRPENSVVALDAHLRQQSTPQRLTLRQERTNG